MSNLKIGSSNFPITTPVSSDTTSTVNQSPVSAVGIAGAKDKIESGQKNRKGLEKQIQEKQEKAQELQQAKNDGGLWGQIVKFLFGDDGGGSNTDRAATPSSSRSYKLPDK